MRLIDRHPEEIELSSNRDCEYDSRLYSLSARIPCNVCNGSGYHSEEFNDLDCWKCDGTGELLILRLRPDLEETE